MPTVAIIGSGEIGNALAKVIEKNARIRVWDKNPRVRHAHKTNSQEDAIRSADVVFLCIPSFAVREAATAAAPFLGKRTVVITLAKGLEAGSLRTMDAVLKESLPAGHPFAILGGPLIAEEIRRGRPGTGAIGCDDQALVRKISPLFKGTTVALKYAGDARSVALASMLKNVYALAVGMAEGLGLGWNARGHLAAESLAEMRGIIRGLDGDAAVIDGPAGAGDFLATAFSPFSKNRATGERIARTGRIDEPSEGTQSLPSLVKLLKKPPRSLPILHALEAVVLNRASVKSRFGKMPG